MLPTHGADMKKWVRHGWRGHFTPQTTGQAAGEADGPSLLPFQDTPETQPR